MVSEQLVQLKLAQEVEEGVQDNTGGVEGLSDDHPSVVILNGLRLEDDQSVFLLLHQSANIDRN